MMMTYLLLPKYLYSISAHVLLFLRDSLSGATKYHCYVRLFPSHAKDKLNRAESLVAIGLGLGYANCPPSFFRPSCVKAKDQRQRCLVNSMPILRRKCTMLATFVVGDKQAPSVGP